MDVVRGAVIIGVVHNHLVDGMVSAAIIGPTHPLAISNDALYIVRMPMLALLIGLFIPRAVAKRGRRRYLRDRVGLMMYLYVVWYAVQGLLEVSTATVKNNPRDLRSLITFWEPIAHLWFLPFLAVATTLVTVTRLYATRTRRTIGAVALLALSIWLWGYNLEIVGLRGLSLLVFVAAGSMLGLERLATLLSGSMRAWLLAGVSSAVGFALLLLLTEPIPASVSRSSTLPQRLFSIVAAVLGIVLVLALSVALARSNLAVRVLGSVGRHSLPIYLAHVVIVAGVRITLSQGATPDPLLYVAVAVPLGVAIPLVVARFAARHGSTSWIFDFPAPLARRLAPPDRPVERTPGAATMSAVPVGSGVIVE